VGDLAAIIVNSIFYQGRQCDCNDEQCNSMMKATGSKRNWKTGHMLQKDIPGSLRFDAEAAASW
jgi:hypothetical protein